MDKHTPGPWVKDYGNTYGHIKAMVQRGSAPTPTLAEYGTCHGCIPAEEAEANGHLLAAAPALLKACREVYETLYDRQDWASCNILLDAIHKATGEERAKEGSK